MYRLTRITKDPGTALKIQVDQMEDGDADGGFQAGGLFHFEPAGQDGDAHHVSEHAARVIMGDPGLAVHFKCQPPLPRDKARGGAVKQSEKPRPGAKREGKTEKAADGPAQDGPAADAAGDDKGGQ